MQAGQTFCSLEVPELLRSMANLVIPCNGVTGHGRQFASHNCSLTPHGKSSTRGAEGAFEAHPCVQHEATL